MAEKNPVAEICEQAAALLHKTSDVTCPNCNTVFGVNVSADLTAQSRIKWRIYPNEGQLLAASTVGGTLSELEHLFDAVAKQFDMRASALVEKIESIEGGGFEFSLLIARNYGSRKAKRRPHAEPPK